MNKPAKKQILALVKRFSKDRKSVWAAEKKKYGTPKVAEEAIDAALGLRPNDKIQNHQRRVGRRALSIARTRLQRARRKIRHARDFCELIKIVNQTTAGVRRFGNLAVYDVAMRIGIWKKVWPKKIYLHAGTREGARSLGFHNDKLSKEVFEGLFDKLQPYQIEDFLCINKEFLKGRRSYALACTELRRSCDDYLAGKIC
jgi:hypothetical protein